MSWIYLALLAPLLFAVANLFDDNLLQHVYKGAHAGTIVSGLFGIVPASLILLAGQYETLTLPLISLSLVAGFLMVVGIYYYFRALQKENPCIVIMLYSLTPAIIPFIAYFLVDERLSLTAYIGFAVVIASAFLYSLTDIKKFTISKALIPVAISALILDLVTLANKYIYTKADFYSSYFYFCMGMVIAGLLFWLLLYLSGTKISPREIYKRNSVKLLGLLAFVEGLAIVAEFAHAKALSLGPVSLVSALENLQSLYVLLIAVVLFPFFPKFFREAEAGNVKIKVVLSVVMILGVYLAVQ